MGPRRPIDDIDVTGARGRTDGFDQKIDVRRIAWPEQVGFQPLDGQHPTQLACQVAVLAPGQYRVEGLLIGLPGGICPPGGLSEFLFRGEVRKTRLDPADSVNIGNRPGTIGAHACSPVTTTGSISRLRSDRPICADLRRPCACRYVIHRARRDSRSFYRFSLIIHVPSPLIMSVRKHGHPIKSCFPASDACWQETIQRLSTSTRGSQDLVSRRGIQQRRNHRGSPRCR